MCGLVLTNCVCHNVTHDKTRNDHTHTREGIYECTATAQQVHIQCEGAWGVNMRERRGVERSVRCSFDADPVRRVREVNVHTSINHT